MFFAITLSVQATTPAPVTLERAVCTSSHIFVGTTKNLRIAGVTADEHCTDQDTVFDGKYLTPCAVVEVDVEVERVLYPAAWKPLHVVRFQFDGGHFEVTNLKQILEERKHLLLTTAVSDESAGIFQNTYPWRLVTSPKAAKQVEKILRACKRN